MGFETIVAEIDKVKAQGGKRRRTSKMGGAWPALLDNGEAANETDPRENPFLKWIVRLGLYLAGAGGNDAAEKVFYRAFKAQEEQTTQKLLRRRGSATAALVQDTAAAAAAAAALNKSSVAAVEDTAAIVKTHYEGVSMVVAKYIATTAIAGGVTVVGKVTIDTLAPPIYDVIVKVVEANAPQLFDTIRVEIKGVSPVFLFQLCLYITLAFALLPLTKFLLKSAPITVDKVKTETPKLSEDAATSIKRIQAQITDKTAELKVISDRPAKTQAGQFLQEATKATLQNQIENLKNLLQSDLDAGMAEVEALSKQRAETSTALVPQGGRRRSTSRRYRRASGPRRTRRSSSGRHRGYSRRRRE